MRTEGQHSPIELPAFFVRHQLPDVTAFHYFTRRAALRSRVTFTHHVACILQRGAREVHSSSGHLFSNQQEILLFNAGSILLTEHLPLNQPFETYMLFFNNAFLSDFCVRNHIDLSEVEAGTELPITTIPKDGFLLQYESGFKAVYKHPIPGIWQHKAAELLLYCLHQFPETTRRFIKSALGESREQQLRRIVAAHLGQHLSIDELSFLCNMSASTFKRHFAEVFHTSPQKYFKEYRMQQAKQALLQHKRPSEVYAELGYESLASFSHEFKKWFGVSPTQYSKQHEPIAEQVDLSEQS